MNILITGGTGFLGRHTARRLVERGDAVTTLGRNDRIGADLTTLGITYRKADLSNKTAVVSACKEHDIVIHCGGLASPWGPYEKFHQANVIGTQNIIAGCLEHGTKKLIHISTPSLYFDYRHRLNIRERDPLPTKQATFYAATKLLADQELIKAQKSGLHAIAIRPRGIFGPGDENVLGRIIRAAERGIIPLVGGGRSYVDLTYIDNVVDAILLCIDAPRSLGGRTYNITNGQPIQSRQMMNMLFSKLGTSPRRLPMPFPVAYGMAGAVERFYSWFRPDQEPPLSRYAVGLMAKSQTLDISAARNELGYSPKVDLEEGMARFAHWWIHEKQTATGLSALGLRPLDRGTIQ